MTQEEFFKRYTYDVVEDRIGGGGFGTVYKAYDNVLHHEVAIKVAEVKTVASGKTFSLKDEVEALSGLPDHPNIAYYEKEKLYTFKTPTGVCDFAVMQYYPDGNLSNAIKQGLTAEQKEDIATQLLEGIDFLHKHKVVHRDLKPGNILIVKHGGKVIPLITDFGLSKAAGVVDGSVFSNSFGAGTPRYSSPEQLQGNPLRFNTDLWSYGAILYELFTGTQLFTAGSGAANTAQADMEIYNKIVNGNVQSLGKMPEMWRKVAERCLVVDASKRAKDAAELFAIIKSDEDETEMGDSGSVGVGASGSKRTEQASSDPDKPTSPSSRGTKQSNGAGGGEPPKTTNDDKPTNKKALWIGLGIAAAVVVALLLLLKPKPAPTPTDPDTQAYEACQTVADYRAYISDYGRNSLHYADAKAFVDQYLADSIEQARKAQALADAAQKEEAERQAQADAEKKEDAAYKKCTTIAACDSYLKAYPDGRYVTQVQDKKTELIAKDSYSIKGAFSVAPGRKVFFATGNLQYQASTKAWRIASNPWDVMGEANSNISSNYSGWIDLFGWGTGDDPTKHSTDDNDYLYFIDWGPRYKSGWRTLSRDEWVYVFNKRITASGVRYARATVNGIGGVILLPDDWSKSTYKLSNTNNNGADCSSNNISASTWNSTLSPAGAVFMPIPGHRHGASVFNIGVSGLYWSSTLGSTTNASAVSCGGHMLVPDSFSSREFGRSVRLVYPAK